MQTNQTFELLVNRVAEVQADAMSKKSTPIELTPLVLKQVAGGAPNGTWAMAPNGTW